MLGSKPNDERAPKRRFPAPSRTKQLPPVAAVQNAAAMRREIEALRGEQFLVGSGQYQVFVAQAADDPEGTSLKSGGCASTFRQVGEGTGRPLDLDRFDRHYEHLFAWNQETSELIGAYRIAKSDVVIERMGTRGLYTNTLFHLQPEFYENIRPALELGRSFVRPEYQKGYLPLLLLWQRLGHYVARNPRYRTLFGPR